MRLLVDSFTYPGADEPALADVELSVDAGEVLLVAGGSGSGKSTLAKILAGVLPGRHGGTLHARFDVGEESILWNDSLQPRPDHVAWNRELAYAGQDPVAQLSFVAATVAEEIAFALENAGVPRATMVQRVDRLATDLDITALLGRDPTTLSGGELRRVTIASAAVLDPAVLVLDEPEAGLDAQARTDVLRLVERLVDAGTGIVLLSGELGGAGRLAGRVLLLDGGGMAGAGDPSDMAELAAARRLPVVPDPLLVPLQAPAVKAAPLVPRPLVPTPLQISAAAAGGAALAELDHVSFAHPRARAGLPDRRRRKGAAPPRTVLTDVSLTLHAGERVLIAGANGAGKTSLLRLFNGLGRPLRGTVRVLEKDTAEVPTGTLATDVGYLFQHPRDQLFERTVEREVGFGVSGPGAATKVAAALRRTGLDSVRGKHPYELPASAQRLVALATVLARSPRVYLLDEPTVAMDLSGRRRLAEAMLEESVGGAAVAMVSHDLDFGYATCDRLVLLSAGAVVADGPIGDVLAGHFGSGTAYGVRAPGAWLRAR